MIIKQFKKGDIMELPLTVLHNEKTGNFMFVLKEVAKQWGHTNATQAARNLLSEKEMMKVMKSEHPNFFNSVISSGVVDKRASSVTLITESALYKLSLASNLEKAKPFRDWVTGEVLPSIRENGSYSILSQPEKLLSHLNADVQKENSKTINSINYKGGVSKIIEYNRESCILHTGKTPSEIKSAGKALGLKSKQTSSAKEVLRNTNKPIACAMSFTDQLVAQGHDLKKISELAMKAAVPLFDGMIKLGITPAELDM